MDKQLKNIFHTRYKAILLLLTFGLLTIYIGSSIETVNAWKTENQWLHSKDVVNDFKERPSDYIKGYDYQGEPVTYANIEEYRKESLTFFTDYFTTEIVDSTKPFTPDRSYQTGRVYWNRFDRSYIPLVSIFIFLIGFGLFFIDLKTNFNAFLFSLSFTKKQLFRGKVFYWTLPLIASITLGTMLYQLIIYLSIPSIYVNATLGQLLYSGFSHVIFILFTFIMGAFFGTLLGNLITAPIMLAAGILSFDLMHSFMNNLKNLLQYGNLEYIIQKTYQIFGSISSVAIHSPGKTASTVATLLVYLVLTCLFFLLAERIYENISLENNGKVLTVPRYRKRFFIILAILTSVYFTFGSIDFVFHHEYYGSLPLLTTVIIPIVCIASSFILTYYDEIFKFWNKRYLNRMIKKTP